jgi:DNA-binding transcriptional MerR regulator
LYSTPEIAAFYRRTDQTIRAWAEEFVRYLSPTANPGKGRGRSFTLEDMQVLSLVAEMKDRGATYEDIHAALQAGQRGDSPSLSDSDMKLLKATEGEKRAAIEIQALQQHIVDLKERLNRAELKAAEADEMRQELVRSETKREMLQSQLDISTGQIAALQEEVRKLSSELSREIGEAKGQAYIAGYRDALKESRGSE